MASINEPRRHTFYLVRYIILGAVLLLGSVYLVYDLWLKRASGTESMPGYRYSITQAQNNSVTYFSSSFFENGPGLSNTAYVSDLTDKVQASFQYNFAASRETELNYSYGVVAEVRGRYVTKGDGGGSSNVWSKQYQLMKPVSESKTTDKISVNPKVEIPYADYKKELDQFKKSLMLPLSSDVIVTFTIKVTGNVDGTALNDVRVSTLTIPSDEQVYKLQPNYDKSIQESIISQDVKRSRLFEEQLEMAGILAMMFFGVGSIAYGFKKHTHRTPYQKELDKIYRHHDGIIVRSSKLVDLSDKRLVSVKSFEDMLSLEEGLQRPIISMTLSTEATKFVILHQDVVYEYVLGVVPRTDDAEAIEQISQSLDHRLAANPSAARKRSSKTKIQG